MATGTSPTPSQALLLPYRASCTPKRFVMPPVLAPRGELLLEKARPSGDSPKQYKQFADELGSISGVRVPRTRLSTLEAMASSPAVLQARRACRVSTRRVLLVQHIELL